MPRIGRLRNGSRASRPARPRAPGFLASCAAGALVVAAGCGGKLDGPPRSAGVIGVTGVLEDTNPERTVVEVNLTARLAQVELRPGVLTPMMTYEGLFPGPLLEANVGDRVIVNFRNEIGESTTIHWHGIRLSDQMDGSPRIQSPVVDGGTFVYDFVVPEASTFWFHPHMNTNVQLEHGLVAPFIVRSPLDPDYDAERVLMLDDVLLDETGAIVPPYMVADEARNGRFGNVLLTNGRPSATARGTSAEGRVERWRLIDTANARSMHLRLVGPAHFRVIGTDGGLLPTPYETSELVFGAGMRFDLEVSYDGPGEVRLENLTPLADADGGVVTDWVPMYTVDVAATGRVPRVIPWPAVPPLPTRVPTALRNFDFEATVDPDAGIRWTINGQDHPIAPFYQFELADTIDLNLRNYSSFEHPFHLHGQFFVIQDGGTPYTQQPGLKDTVLVPPSSTVRVTSYLDNPGRWMIHCHNLEHAERGMMGEITVGDAGAPYDGHVH